MFSHIYNTVNLWSKSRNKVFFVHRYRVYIIYIVMMSTLQDLSLTNNNKLWKYTKKLYQANRYLKRLNKKLRSQKCDNSHWIVIEILKSFVSCEYVIHIILYNTCGVDFTVMILFYLFYTFIYLFMTHLKWYTIQIE